MAGEYIINYTDETLPGKTPFVIGPNEVNGPDNVNVNTALQLQGRFVVNYGEIVAENLVHLLENFASKTGNEPTVTTAGMIWFKSDGGNNGEGELRVRNTTNDAWIPVGATYATTGGAGGKFNIAPSGGTVYAVPGGNYFVDTTSGPVTVVLPASPTLGDVVGVVDLAGTFGVGNECFIDGNGERVMSDPSDMAIDIQYARVKLAYSNADHGWRIVG